MLIILTTLSASAYVAGLGELALAVKGASALREGSMFNYSHAYSLADSLLKYPEVDALCTTLLTCEEPDQVLNLFSLKRAQEQH